nr:MAG TPA: hypothetical protein [Crassvirales sp.]
MILRLYLAVVALLICRTPSWLGWCSLLFHFLTPYYNGSNQEPP